MTRQSALEFFAQYGNVHPDIEKLNREQPTKSELDAAVDRAVKVYNQPLQIALDAAMAITENKND